MMNTEKQLRSIRSELLSLSVTVQPAGLEMNISQNGRKPLL
jgi:hypothetical protein